MRDLWIAFFALSIGWGMHAELARRFCLKCSMRTAALKLAKLTMRPMPQFIMKLLLTFAVSWMGLLIIQEIAQVFGWKNVLRIVTQITKGYIKDGKRPQNVP
jgi:hypothetical protein